MVEEEVLFAQVADEADTAASMVALEVAIEV